MWFYGNDAAHNDSDAKCNPECGSGWKNLTHTLWQSKLENPPFPVDITFPARLAYLEGRHSHF